MRYKPVYLGLGLVVLFAMGLQWRSTSYLTLEEFRAVPLRNQVEAAPMCPWRQPDADLKKFFPHATGYRTESPALSDFLIEITERLGRMPTPDENPLYLHRVHQGSKPVGTVLVRRVKGEYGAIELVLAVDVDGKVRKLHLQRLRESEAVSKALRASQWLASFEGKTANSQWKLGKAMPDVPPVGRKSAEAVVEGVRSMLILLQTLQEHLQEQSPQVKPHH